MAKDYSNQENINYAKIPVKEVVQTNSASMLTVSDSQMMIVAMRLTSVCGLTLVALRGRDCD